MAANLFVYVVVKDPFWCNVCISNEQTFQIVLSLQPLVLGNTYH
jgi:hypothetical protein